MNWRYAAFVKTFITAKCLSDPSYATEGADARYPIAEKIVLLQHHAVPFGAGARDNNLRSLRFSVNPSSSLATVLGWFRHLASDTAVPGARSAVFYQRTAGSSSSKEPQEAPRESQCVQRIFPPGSIEKPATHVGFI
jgi:hypothetical protein